MKDFIERHRQLIKKTCWTQLGLNCQSLKFQVLVKCRLEERESGIPYTPFSNRPSPLVSFLDCCRLTTVCSIVLAPVTFCHSLVATTLNPNLKYQSSSWAHTHVGICSKCIDGYVASLSRMFSIITKSNPTYVKHSAGNSLQLGLNKRNFHSDSLRQLLHFTQLHSYYAGNLCRLD